MLKTLSLTFAISAASALFATAAGALPLVPANQLGAGSGLTLASDGCGPGKRFSNSRGHCVWKDGERGFREERHERRRERATDDAADAVDSVLGIITSGPRHKRRHND